MQDKNKLDDMTKRYKDEMMRLYSKKRTATDNPAVQPDHAAVTVPAVSKAIAAVNSEQPKVKTVPSKPRRDLSNPPLPEIPSNYGRGAEVPLTDVHNGKGKFPPAEEIMLQEFSSEPAVMTVSTSVSPEARFVPVETERHRQGNYYFSDNDDDNDDDIENIIEEIVPDIDYPDEDTDFEEPDDDDFFEENPPNMNGKGYLQIEVTAADGTIPIEDATVIVTQKINGTDSLVSMAVTDDNGATDPIALPAPPQSLSESPAPSERPYSEYNVGVYKKGFYSIPKLTVPIFDTIKSIQPVSLIPLAEFELEGTKRPAGNNRNTN